MRSPKLALLTMKLVILTGMNLLLIDGLNLNMPYVLPHVTVPVNHILTGYQSQA